MFSWTSIPFWTLCAILFLFLLFCWLVRFVILYWRKQDQKNILLRAFVDAGLRPFLFMIFSFGMIKSLRFSLNWARDHGREAVFSPLLMLEPYFGLLITFIVTYLLLSWKGRVFRLYEANEQLMKSYSAVFPTFERLISVFIWVLGIYWSLSLLQIDLSVLFAVGGIGGIATGFAAKDVVGNFFGGLMVFINRPFKKGEKIKSTNRNFEGFVDEVGFYMTRLRTLERFPVYIPNGQLTEAIIENPSRRTHRKLKVQLGLRYCDFGKISSITSQINEYLKADKRVDKSLTHGAHFSKYGESGLEILILAYMSDCSLDQWLKIQEEVLLKIGQIIESCGAQIAFPTRTVHMDTVQ